MEPGFFGVLESMLGGSHSLTSRYRSYGKDLFDVGVTDLPPVAVPIIWQEVQLHGLESQAMAAPRWLMRRHTTNSTSKSNGRGASRAAHPARHRSESNAVRPLDALPKQTSR